MFDFVNYSTEQLQIFLIVLLRITGVFLMAPVLSHSSVSTTVKVGLAIVLAIILTSVMGPVDMAPITDLWFLAGIAIREILIGAVIGLFFQLLFYAAQTAGSLIGYQVGLAIATEFDPTMKGQVSIIGRFWFMVALLLFITMNGHHLIISALADSFRVIPPGSSSLTNGTVAEMLIKYTAYVFVVALKIAAPVMLTLFLTDVALGTLAKTMPTMNVFFVGFPIKIAVGLLVIALSLPIVSFVLEKSTHYLDRELELMVLAMGKA